jgi:hypothetical protein
LSRPSFLQIFLLQLFLVQNRLIQIYL